MNHRLLFMGFAAAPLWAAGVAVAQSNAGFQVTASAAQQACAMEAPALSGGVLVNFRGLDGTTLRVDQLTDPRTLATRAASAEISFDAACSFPHRVVLESERNGLWRNASTSAAAGFADAVPYSADLAWAGVNARVEADADARRPNQTGVSVNESTSGQIVIRLAILAGASNLQANAPLMAGIYQDTLRVTLEPQ